MAPPLSQSEIQEITRLLEHGKPLPEKYRDILFVDQQIPSEDPPASANPEPPSPAEHPLDEPLQTPSDENSTTAFSLTEFGKFLLDNPQIKHTVSKYTSRVDSWTRGTYINNRIEDLATMCTNEIIAMVPQILQDSEQREYSLRWQNQNETTLPKDTRRQLLRVVRERLLQREIELKEEQKAKEKEQEAKEKEREANESLKENEAAAELLAKYTDIVNTFLAIAERKVSVLDEYGDERIHLLPSLVDDCVAKIAGREGNSEILIRVELKKGGIWLHKRHKELLQLRRILIGAFTKYHEEQKGKKKTIEELATLSGVDFETAVGGVLLENGWHVTATATTGDQGADIIASKGERRVIIQAKRYSGTVGNKAVQEVVRAIAFYGGTEGCVVTNSTFTPSARALAQKNNIRLIDGSRFAEVGEL
jgi:hypothetical protein